MSVVTSIRTAAAKAWREPPHTQAQKPATSEFARMLQVRLDERRIAVSAHAADRMVRRGVRIDENTVDQLHTAFEMATRKGAREALFLLEGMAVIASVRDRTVKTALSRSDMEAGVFTQIDTTVVLSNRAVANDQTNQPINQSPGSIGWAPTREAAIQPGGLPL